MAAITWRTIDLPNNGAANALLAAGGQSIERGLNRLAQTAETIGTTQNDNWDTISKQNTSDVIAKLNEITSPTALQEEIQDGSLSTDKMDEAFGRQYNKAAVSDAINKRRVDLVNMERVNLLNQEAQANKQATLARNLLSRQFDAFATQEITKSSDPDRLNAVLQRQMAAINSQGLIPGFEASKMIDSYVDRVRGIGLDVESQGTIKYQEERLPTMISESTSAIDHALKEFQTKGGYDYGTEQMLNDQMSVADATLKLSEQLSSKGANVDTVAIGRRIEEINNRFTNAGLAAPNGKTIYEIMTQGGKKDGWISDASFRNNTDVMDSVINKIKKNQVFKESNSTQLAEFARAKVAVVDSANEAVNNNRKQLLRSARANAFQGQAHSPAYIELNEVQELQNQWVQQLKDLKPSGTNP